MSVPAPRHVPELSRDGLSVPFTVAAPPLTSADAVTPVEFLTVVGGSVGASALLLWLAVVLDRRWRRGRRRR